MIKANRRVWWVGLALLGMVVLLWALLDRLHLWPAVPHSIVPAASQNATLPVGATQVSATPPLFVHYYLWWDDQHWRAKLGPQYPYQQASPPLPAQLNADGCSANSTYRGDQLIDIPDAPLNLYSQDNTAVFDQHIADAAGAGIAGFVVSWAGNGQPNQTPNATAFNRRLDSLVQRVARYNASHATKFYLMLGYEGLDNNRTPRPTSWITNDLGYFLERYQSSPVFAIPYYQNKFVMLLLGSRNLGVADIAKFTDTFTASQRTSALIVGDEHGLKEWSRGVSRYFDGDGWYWSDQNPYTNPGAFKAIDVLASALKSEQKVWFAPLSGGYNKANFAIGGACIPRNEGNTMREVYNGNKGSNPDGWMYISWNEFYENTYLEPSQRYGRFYLDQLKAIIRAQ